MFRMIPTAKTRPPACADPSCCPTHHLRSTAAMRSDPVLQELTQRPYEHGFVTDIDSDAMPPGLDEDVI